MATADHAGGDDQAVGGGALLEQAAGADANEGVGADGPQLFEGDGGRGAADAGGDHGDGDAVEAAGIGGVFAVGLDVLGIIQKTGDDLNALGAAGQKDVATHITSTKLDVILWLFLSHMRSHCRGGGMGSADWSQRRGAEK